MAALKKKTISIIAIVVLVLSLVSTIYIIWKVNRTEDVTPDESEAGGLDVGERGCANDSDCASAPNGITECDERDDGNVSLQRCEYYKCDSGYELSKDRLECTLIVEEEYSCGESGCSVDSDCTDTNNVCTNGTCQLESCSGGYELSSDKCSCVEVEEDPECGDGIFNISGEVCEYGNPSGYECSWTDCNQSSCTCPEPSSSDSEESETTTSQGEDVVVDSTETDELPETGIEDLPKDVATFYWVFIVSGGVLILSYVLESPKKKWQNSIMDRFEK